MLNDIIYWSLKLKSNSEDEKNLAIWMLYQYGEYMNTKPVNHYKIGSIGRFYHEFLSVKETALKNDLEAKKEDITNKIDSETKKEDSTNKDEKSLTDKEIEELLEELI